MDRFWQSYNKKLEEHPLCTKAISAGVVGGLGEIISQLFVHQRSGGKVNMDRITRLRRVAVFFCFGAAITGPVFHFWYKLLDRWTSSIKNPQLKTALQLFLDRGLLAPVFLLFTLSCLHYFLSPTSTFKSAKTHALSTFRSALTANYLIFLPTQAVSFAYVPLELRVLFGNVVSLLWNVRLALFSNA